ncbi:MAG: hypothetical protein SFY80_11255 [Verrucomicrobiota bacterium]|nr:hypothetical protein [Verrucomicrobiota bacterium]
MKTTRKIAYGRSRKGSLAVVLIITTAMSMIIAGTLTNAVMEARLNNQQYTTLSANNAAESLTEYGVAQLIKRWQYQTVFRDSELSTANKPLTVNSDFISFLTRRSGSTNADKRVTIKNWALIGGVVPPNIQFYVDPEDPENKDDRHKGKMVLARDVEVYASATASTPYIGDRTAYAAVTFQLRDAPLFSHAIFYNMDLEFHNGPDMDIMGPVHSNGNIWAVSQGYLKFHGIVTTAKDYRVSMMAKPYQGDWTSMPGEGAQKGTSVWMKDADGTWLNTYRGSGTLSKESSYWSSVASATDLTAAGWPGGWADWSSNKFDGNLQSKVHNVPKLNPVGYDEYVPDETGSTEVKNHAYALIEPNMKLTDSKHKNLGEDEKLARKAGLIIRVHKSTNGTTKTNGQALPANAVRLRKRPSPDSGWSAGTRDWINGSSTTPSTYNTDYYVSFHTLKRADPLEPNSALVLNTESRTIVNAKGESINILASEVIEEDIRMSPYFDPNNTSPKTSAGAALRARFDEMIAAHPFVKDGSGNITSGMRDQRIDATMPEADSNLNVVEINMAALANEIEVSNGNMFDNYYTPYRYNGVVYVEFDRDTAATVRSDNITKAVKNHALMLTQGGGSNTNLGRVPNPSFNINKENRDEGFTLVTNAPLYVKGHFNADGNMSTPSATDFNNSDVIATPRPPVALAADAITILSNSWTMAGSKNKNTVASDTEFAAAIIAGLQPTNKAGTGNNKSGGSHNFPRFLEDWGGKKFRYRGSLVALFESEIQNQSWSTGYYSPPTRQWGFYKEFANGNFPPGTPNVRDYKKMDFRYLTKTEYNAKVNALPWH